MSGEAMVDGRRARRERSRKAVIDAAFDLTLEGKGPPTVESVAARADVSVSSIFRNFDGLADIQHQALQQFRERYAHLLQLEATASDSCDRRVSQFVTSRVELYGEAGPLMSLARLRALEHEPMVAALADQRALLAEQTRAAFGSELRRCPRSVEADLLAVVDSLTSPEAFEVMRRSHARSRMQIVRAWTHAVRALLAAVPPPNDEARTTP